MLLFRARLCGGLCVHPLRHTDWGSWLACLHLTCSNITPPCPPASHSCWPQPCCVLLLVLTAPRQASACKGQACRVTSDGTYKQVSCDVTTRLRLIWAMCGPVYIRLTSGGYGAFAGLKHEHGCFHPANVCRCVSRFLRVLGFDCRLVFFSPIERRTCLTTCA